MIKNISENFMLAERTVRDFEHPHSIQFPAMLSKIKTSFLNLGPRTGIIEAHNRSYKTDLDYFFQMGVSTEGFGLKFGMDNLLKTGKWNNEPLKDCFLSEGIKYRFIADESIQFKDDILILSAIKEKVVAHLSSGLPVILLKKGNSYMSFNLVLGYKDYGNCLMGHHGAGRAKSITKLAKPWYNWVNEICAAIFIDGVVDPVDRKGVILRSLSRAHEMLTETNGIFSEYGYGKHMWETWISRLDNNNNYKAKSNVLKYIVPEKFDLAERRAFAAHFFKEAEIHLGDNLLADAFDAFTDIHNKMWDIHWMVTGDNEGKLLERETRDKIICILIECQMLDLKAAENIKQVLNKCEQSEPSKFDNHVNVIGADGQSQNPTYLRRAKGLVKNGRAEWADEKTIRIFESSDEADKPEKSVEKYQCHCQHQAESFARAILSVPKDYPLRAGLPTDFKEHFSKLCELAKNIYMDMTEQPEAYGLMLVDIASKDHNLARDGYRTIHRFVDTLSNLSNSGEVNNHRLIVNLEKFKTACKGGRGFVSGPVPKYELILSRLVDFGFVISGFEGKPFGKKVESFAVEYPDHPEMIDAIKIYCECWDSLKFDKGTIKIWPKEFHHHYYRFDYKITANREEIPMAQWVSDEADYLGYSPEQKTFSLEFYKNSLQYRNVNFDGDYIYKSKRIARMCQVGYIAVGKPDILLSVKIKNMDNYMTDIEGLPDSLKKPLTEDNCQHCNFQGATADHCKFRLHWTFEDKAHVGCAHMCFFFDDFDVERVSDYWRLLELEYDLKKA